MIQVGFSNDCHYINSPSFFPGFERAQSLNLIKEYDRSDREMNILWVDHIKLVAEKTGIDPL